MVFLDTDVMIDLFRQYLPAITWLKELGDEEIGLSGFVVMELIQGCQNKREQTKLKKALSNCQIIWPSEKTCNQASDVFADYYLSHSLGLLDALIGQTAVSLNIPLYTFNQKHYTCIPELNTNQPYQKY